MSEVSSDNRFELIGEFKDKIVKGTNIETSPEEMAVLDNILFRIWQMGWLDKLKAQEPRVMTLDELVMWQKQPVIERDPIYVEYRKGKGFGAPHWAMDNFGFNVATCQDNYKSGVYGILVRCWTSRPDEEKRAETPWDCLKWSSHLWQSCARPRHLV